MAVRCEWVACCRLLEEAYMKGAIVKFIWHAPVSKAAVGQRHAGPLNATPKWQARDHALLPQCLPELLHSLQHA